MSAKYTLQLQTIYNDEHYNLFDFPYNLYDNDLKLYFEEKFYQHFMFYEIAFDNIFIFKQHLASTLNDIYPYYKQLYETEIRCKNIDFMLNKDLKETYTREITGNVVGNNSSSSTSSDNSSTNNLDILNDTPQNAVNDIDRYMTTANKSNTETNNNMNSNSNSSSETESKNIEKYELLSQGNIGVTSSAELLEKWRNVLINIDMLIFKELESLFLMVY